MHKALDTRYYYRGMHGCPSHCQLRICEIGSEQGERIVVVAAECSDNRGTSVTNFAEELATAAWKMLDRPPRLIWIESYALPFQTMRRDSSPTGKRGGWAEVESAFRRVEFVVVPSKDSSHDRFAFPRWHSMSRPELAALLGQSAA